MTPPPEVRCVVHVDLNGTGGPPVDRAALAIWLRRPRSSVLAEIADAVEQADGGTASVKVRMSAVDADRVRHLLDQLIDSATNATGWPKDEILTARKAAYGLRVVSRAWDRDTGWDPRMRRLDNDMEEELGGGYRRR